MEGNILFNKDKDAEECDATRASLIYWVPGTKIFYNH